MKILIILIIALVTTACGKPHSYQVGTCFKMDEMGLTFKKIVNIIDDRYLVKLYYKDIPEDYKDLGDVLPLPDRVTYDELDLNLKLVVIPCPR